MICTEKIQEFQKKLCSQQDELRKKEKMIESLSSNLKMTGRSVGADADREVFESIRSLNRGVEELNSGIKTRNKVKIQRLKEEISLKEEEVNNLLQERQTYLKKVKEEADTRIKNVKQALTSRIEELEEKVRLQYENNKTYKAELHSKTKLELEVKRLKLAQKDCEDRLQSLKELIETKEEKGKIDEETITNFIKEIEKTTIEKRNFRDLLFKAEDFKKNLLLDNQAIIKCVNIVSTENDKKKMALAVKELDRKTRMNLAPFFGVNKVKI